MSDSSKTKPQPPPVIPEADWQEIQLPFNIGSGRSLYTGLEGHERLRLRVFRRTTDSHLVGRVWFGPGADGPPGHAHGGAIAYVLDEAMGSVAWMNHYPVVAAKLEFQYERMTPLATDLLVEAWIDQITKKRVLITAQLKLPNGKPCVTGKGEFAILAKSKIAGLLTTSDQDAEFFADPKLKWALEEAD